MSSDVSLAKLATIERCLARIRTKTGGDPQAVRDLDVQEIVILNLQRAAQACIDLAAQLIAVNGWGLPDTLGGHFRVLREQGVIDGELETRLKAMVGFRNIAVHDYEALDTAILERVVAEHLEDFERFADAVRQRLTSTPE
ncbi:type VII toxin-antitoxin system HepT family RNase toxin [Endothiovibrio diazotrophicus]